MLAFKNCTLLLLTLVAAWNPMLHGQRTTMVSNIVICRSTCLGIPIAANWHNLSPHVCGQMGQFTYVVNICQQCVLCHKHTSDVYFVIQTHTKHWFFCSFHRAHLLVCIGIGAHSTDSPSGCLAEHLQVAVQCSGNCHLLAARILCEVALRFLWPHSFTDAQSWQLSCSHWTSALALLASIAWQDKWWCGSYPITVGGLLPYLCRAACIFVPYCILLCVC